MKLLVYRFYSEFLDMYHIIFSDNLEDAQKMIDIENELTPFDFKWDGKEPELENSPFLSYKEAKRVQTEACKEQLEKRKSCLN